MPAFTTPTMLLDSPFGLSVQGVEAGFKALCLFEVHVRERHLTPSRSGTEVRTRELGGSSSNPDSGEPSYARLKSRPGRGDCQAWSKAPDSGSGPVGVRGFKSLSPHSSPFANRRGAIADPRRSRGGGTDPPQMPTLRHPETPSLYPYDVARFLLLKTLEGWSYDEIYAAL